MNRGPGSKAAALVLCALLLAPAGAYARRPEAVSVSSAPVTAQQAAAHEATVSGAAAPAHPAKKKRSTWLKWLAGLAVIGVLVALVSSSGDGGSGGGY